MMPKDRDRSEQRPDGGEVARFRPPITQTTHTLPFNQLSWRDFERLCLALLPREGFGSPQHYGAAGGEQGRDIVAHRDGEPWYVQCKRVKECGPQVLLDEVEKVRGLMEGDPDLSPAGMLFIASRDVSATARDRVSKRCSELGLACEVWGRTDLDARVQQHPDIVRVFFGWYTRPPIGVPFQAPPLPPHFVPRPEVSDALKACLLADETIIPGTLVISAIHGLGGIGKSVLAAALAHDAEVQERFPDGVLWAVLGQQPEILSLLSSWIQALGDHDFHPTTVEAASAHLRTLLHDKTALLVVDDVWNPTHVLPLQIGGPRCQVLITTRRADVADEVGADLYQLDVMTEAQSLDLLSARLGRTLVETEREEALRLAEAVGYLPLALELTAARVARGTLWTTLRHALEEEIARLEALEGPRRRRKVRPRLEASFNLSLNALRTEDETAWQAFVWLGILPEDVLVAAPMAATLWEMDRAEASDMLELLWNDALLLPGPPVQVGEQTRPAYRLHDLLHDMARRLLTTEHPQGLGFTLPEAHARLLERYRAKTQDNLWHTLPDDGYIHAYLGWHLEQAGREDELHILLCEETAEGRNGWYKARDRLGQTGGYLDDVARAWNVARRSGILPLEIQYALIESSVHSLAQGLPAELLIGILQYKSNLMSPTVILDRVRQLPRIWQRADTLYDLAPYLPDEILPDALALALTIARENERGLLGLAPYLPPDLLEVALHHLPDSADEGTQVRFFEAVISTIPDRLLDLALTTARQIQGADCRAVALSCLTARLSDNLLHQVVLEALNTASQPWHYPSFRAKALMYLAPHVSPGQIEETWEAERYRFSEIEHDMCCAWLALAYCRAGSIERALPLLKPIFIDEYSYEAISKIAPELPEDHMSHMLDCLPRDRRRFERPKALGILARYGSAELQCQILNMARSEDFDDACRLVALTSIVPHLRQPETQNQVWDEVFATLHGFSESTSYGWNPWQLNAYREVIEFLPTDLVCEVVQESHSTRTWCKIALESLNKLTGPLKKAVCLELLSRARQDDLEWDILISMLTKLTPRVSPVEREELFNIVLRRARRIEAEDPYEPLAPYKALISGVWEERPSRDYFREGNHVRVLLTMTPHSPQPGKMACLALKALDALEPYYFKYCLRELVPLLPLFESDQQAYLIERILKTVNLSAVHHDIESTDVTHILRALVTITSGKSRKQTIDHILSLAKETSVYSERVLFLSLIVDYLPESDRQDVLTELMHWLEENADAPEPGVFWTHGDDEPYLRSLSLVKSMVWIGVSTCASLSDHDALLDRVLASFSLTERSNESKLALALVQIASSLPPEIARPIFERAANLVREGIRSRRGSAHILLAYLPDDLKAPILVELLRWAATINWHYKLRPTLLISLAEFWAQLPKEDACRILQEVLPLFAQGDRKQFLWDLHAIAPVFLALGGESAIEAIVEEIHQVMTWWP